MSGNLQRGDKAATPAQKRRAQEVFQRQALDRITDIVLAHKPKGKQKKSRKRKKVKR